MQCLMNHTTVWALGHSRVTGGGGTLGSEGWAGREGTSVGEMTV